MNDTPETDAAVKESNGQWSNVLKETCQRLERERNKAAEDATNYYAKIGELERERDEARNDLEFRRELYRVQENYLELARKERDEALEDARLLSERLTRLELDSTLALAKLERERNQWRIQYEQAERVLQDIATGTSCRECGGEDQARLAREALEGAK